LEKNRIMPSASGRDERCSACRWWRDIPAPFGKLGKDREVKAEKSKESLIGANRLEGLGSELQRVCRFNLGGKSDRIRGKRVRL